mgnify:CR=1 FL=1|tara:strand:- start:272 stop:535 length:264 start_codon:yes stop_codon:yes gene_type:complete
MKNMFNIGIGLLILLVVLLIVGQDSVLSVPHNVYRDVSNVGRSLEHDFTSSDMHQSNYDVLGLINRDDNQNYNDNNSQISDYLMEFN